MQVRVKDTVCVRACSPWVLGLEPVEQGVFVEGGRGGAVAVVALDVSNGVRVLHHLDQARLVARGEASIGDHPRVNAQRQGERE